MISGQWLKQPWGKDDQVIESLHQLEVQVKNKNWAKAEEQHQLTQKYWKKVANRIQFSVERESMFEINSSISKIRGAIEAKDEATVLTEIYHLYNLWDNLG